MALATSRLSARRTARALFVVKLRRLSLIKQKLVSKASCSLKDSADVVASCCSVERRPGWGVPASDQRPAHFTTNSVRLLHVLGLVGGTRCHMPVRAVRCTVGRSRHVTMTLTWELPAAVPFDLRCTILVLYCYGHVMRSTVHHQVNVPLELGHA